MFRLKRGIVEAEALQGAGEEVFDQHIAVGDEIFQQCNTGGGLEIDRDALLVAVGAEVIGAEVAFGQVLPRWPPLARAIAHVGLFDLDDLRAIVAEQLRAIRPSEDAREIEDADVGEGGGGVRVSVRVRAGHRLFLG